MADPDRVSLTPQQVELVEGLLSGASYRAGAAQVGVSERTVRRWVASGPVADALAEAKGELTRALWRKVRALASKALDVIEAELDGPDRLRAARLVLEALRWAEAEDLAVRVSELERIARAGGPA